MSPANRNRFRDQDMYENKELKRANHAFQTLA